MYLSEFAGLGCDPNLQHLYQNMPDEQVRSLVGGTAFSGAEYRARWPDVAADPYWSQNPERHWLACGRYEGRPFPDGSWLRAQQSPPPAPAPAAAPAPAPAPAQASAPAPAPYTAPIAPQAGASQSTTTMLPTEVDVASPGSAPLQLTDVTPAAGGAPASSGGNGGLLLLLLGGAAALMGGS